MILLSLFSSISTLSLCLCSNISPLSFPISLSLLSFILSFTSLLASSISFSLSIPLLLLLSFTCLLSTSLSTGKAYEPFNQFIQNKIYLMEIYQPELYTNKNEEKRD
eukprot:38572_1